ncbi:MAG: DUF3108 domain-containing protein [Pseudomonadota bacterium]
MLRVAFALLLAALPAHAVASAPAGWRYDVYWMGLPVGEGTFGRAETGDGYRALWSMETEGLVAGFLHLDVEGMAEGQLTDGRPVPSLYRNHLRTAKREGQVAVSYAPRGPQARLLENTIRWTAPPGPDDKNPPPVPGHLRRGVDPATGMVLVGRGVRRAFHGGPDSFAVPVYDGVRRFDLRVRVVGLEEVHVWWQSFPAVELAAEIVPIAGFEEPEKWDSEPIQVHLDPATMLPRRIETRGIVITADEPCADLADCRG